MLLSVYGIPNDGLVDPAKNMKEYLWPDHNNIQLKNRYFEHFQNPHYNDVEIMPDRLESLPQEREEYTGLKTVYMEKEIPENEKGPAPKQFDIPYSANDESYTSSSIILPAEPKDISKEIKEIVKKLIGSDKLANTFALAEVY